MKMGRRAVVVGTVVWAAAFAGCGDGQSPRDTPPDAQPAPGTPGFSEGVFNGLPRYPRSDEAGDRSSKDGVVAQSFRAEGASPEAVLNWYRDNLAGWTPVEPVSQIGAGTYRGRWARDAYFLVVSATPGPTLPEQPSADEAVAQYSLSLEPRP